MTTIIITGIAITAVTAASRIVIAPDFTTLSGKLTLDEKQQLIEQLLGEGYDDPEVIEAVVHERLGKHPQQSPPVVAKPNDPSMLPGHGKTKTVGAEDFMPGVLDGIKGRVGEFLQPLAEQQQRNKAAEDLYFKTGKVTPLEEQYPGPPKGALMSAVTYPVTGAAQVITDLGEGTREGNGKAITDAAAYLPVLLGMRKGVTKPIGEGATNTIKNVARAVTSEQGNRYVSAAQKGMFPFLFEGVRHLAEHVAGDPKKVVTPADEMGLTSDAVTRHATATSETAGPANVNRMRQGTVPTGESPAGQLLSPEALEAQQRLAEMESLPQRAATEVGAPNSRPPMLASHETPGIDLGADAAHLRQALEVDGPGRSTLDLNRNRGGGPVANPSPAPSPNAGGALNSTKRPTLDSQLIGVLDNVRNPPIEKMEAMPSHPSGGAHTEPVQPNSYNGVRTNAADPLNPKVESGPKPEPQKPTTEPTKTEAPKKAETPKTEPPKTEPTTDRPPSKSKRRSQVDGLSDADIDSRAASRGVPRETIIAEEMAELRKRAERHMAHRKAANASPTEMLKELMKYREKFGPDFMKGTE